MKSGVTYSAVLSEISARLSGSH